MSEIDEYVEYLRAGINNAIDETLEETATIVVADTKLTTPVKTGNLKRSWTHDNVEHNGDTYTVEVGSSCLYAPFVEEGHRTRGNTFVQGKFMLNKSILKNEDNLQKTLDRKLNELR